MILSPGLYTVNSDNLELIANVIAEWCGNRNHYACYMSIEKHGSPVLCMPMDETALAMFKETHLLPENLFPQGRKRRRLPAQPHLEIVR